MYSGDVPSVLQREARALNRYPRRVRRGETHKVGRMYWSGYWEDWYEVIGEEFDGGERCVVCRWRDGRISRSMTPLKNWLDWELVPI